LTHRKRLRMPSHPAPRCRTPRKEAASSRTHNRQRALRAAHHPPRPDAPRLHVSYHCCDRALNPPPSHTQMYFQRLPGQQLQFQVRVIVPRRRSGSDC
jgi:hypothetical protein